MCGEEGDGKEVKQLYIVPFKKRHYFCTAKKANHSTVFAVRYKKMIINREQYIEALLKKRWNVW